MDHSLGLRILYVEDDISIREALRDVLESAGYHVTVAGTAQAGLEALRQVRFHLVITDYTLPDFNGAKMLRTAAEEDALECECLILTGASMLDNTIGYRILRKPIDVDKLLQKIDELLAPVRNEELARARALLERSNAEQSVAVTPSLELALYVSEASPASLRAVRNLERLLGQYEPGQVSLQVIDLSKERPPEFDEDRITFTPTLVKRLPQPRVYMLGSLDQIESVTQLLSAAQIQRRR